MTANEFVKKYGFNGAYKLRQGLFNLFENNLCILSGSVCRLSDNEPLFSLGELKRLVESHELIRKDFESVEMAEYEYMISASYNESYWVRVKQAIADVESCMGVSSESN